MAGEEESITDIDSDICGQTSTSSSSQHSFEENSCSTSSSPETGPDNSTLSDIVQERRNLLNSKLTGHKSEKLKRKLPLDTQLLSYAQEELKMKKQMTKNMEAIEKDSTENMNKLFSNMKD